MIGIAIKEIKLTPFQNIQNTFILHEKCYIWFCKGIISKPYYKQYIEVYFSDDLSKRCYRIWYKHGKTVLT